MAISNAVERDGYVYIYDENGFHMGTVSVGQGPDDGLKSFTASTVNVRNGVFILSYDVNGAQTGYVQA